MEATLALLFIPIVTAHLKTACFLSQVQTINYQRIFRLAKLRMFLRKTGFLTHIKLTGPVTITFRALRQLWKEKKLKFLMVMAVKLTPMFSV